MWVPLFDQGLCSLAQSVAPDAATLFYLTLLFIFLTAIVTTVVTKWSRDKCLRYFRDYRITLERSRGQTMWGNLKVFSSGIEVMYDHAYIDLLGRRKTSYLFYQGDLDSQILSFFRFHDQLAPQQQAQRIKQIHKTFNPGILRRAIRKMRNFVNTLRDAFNTAIGTLITQYQRVNPANMVLSTQGSAVTNISQTLLGKFANAYEPLLEQYIGQPVILDVLDPINPNNVFQEYAGYLADYTQQYIAVFNVEHGQGEEVSIRLPNVDKGDPLPPLPFPPPPGGVAPMLPPPLLIESGIAVRIDADRFKVQNTRREMLAVDRLEISGMAPLELGMVLPPMATLNLPAGDARGAKLVCRVLRCADVIAPRKYATIRHAGVLVERPGIADELPLDWIPLVAKLFKEGGDGNDKHH